MDESKGVSVIMIFGFVRKGYKKGPHGEKRYDDETQYPKLELREGGTKKTVLATEITPINKWPMATIKEKEGAVNYILPEQYSNFCQEHASMDFFFGYSILPAEVVFTRKGEEYTLEVL